jgi:hypothetical protein
VPQPTQPISLNSRWRYKQSLIEVTVKRVTIGTVSYIAVDKSASGSVPQWQFLENFQPVTEKKKPASDKQGNSSPAKKPRRPA